MRRLLPLAVLLLPSVAIANPAQGTLVHESPTRGIEVPTRSMAGDPDATTIETNASNLAFLQRFHLTFLHVDLNEGSRGGAGDALFWGNGMERWNLRFATGFGLEFLRPPKSFDFDGDPTTNEQSVKIIYGFAAGHGPIAIGFGGEHFFANQDKRLDGFDTFSLSATARPSRFLSVGFAVHDLFGQRANFVEVGQTLEGELALRPLGRSTFEVAVGARYDERNPENGDPRLRILLSPVEGVVLRFAAEIAQRRFDPASALTRDARFTAGIEFDLENYGIAFSGLANTSKDAGRSLGFATLLRYSTERYPAVHVAPGRVLRVAPERPKDEAALVALILHLRAIAADPRVSGVILDLSRFDASLAGAEELRGAVAALRRAGKRTVAYLGNANTRLYHLASACDSVAMDPAADLDLTGIEGQQLFFKSLLDRLGVRADFLQVGEFKSAPEVLMREHSSEPAREMTTGLVASLNGILATALAADRKLDLARATTLLTGGPYSARAALEAGLVDALLRQDELARPFASLIGTPIQIEDEPLPPRRPGAFTLPHVAVVLIEGNILDDEPEIMRTFGGVSAVSYTLVKTLDELGADPRVRAVVLRVASPGGAVLASDRIANAVERLRKRKPVVASFAEVAASGGYYAAVPAQGIYALNTSICGSIGIFGGKIEISKLLDLLGINVETYGGSARARLNTLFAPYSEDDQKALMALLTEHYRQFIAVVARGRGMPAARVEELAKGRVYTGQDALAVGLVDHIGGLAEALADAIKRTRLPPDEVEVIVLPEPRNVRELKQLLADEAFGRVLSPALRGAFLRMAEVTLTPGNRAYARLPFELLLR